MQFDLLDIFMMHEESVWTLVAIFKNQAAQRNGNKAMVAHD